MLVLSLSVVTLLRALGAIDLLTAVLRPLPELLHINPQLILPTLSKYLAGGTAMMGLMGELPRDGQLGSAELNRSIGFLLNPLDVPGLADLPAFFGPLRHWKLASGFAALPHDCLNAAGVC